MRLPLVLSLVFTSLTAVAAETTTASTDGLQLLKFRASQYSVFESNGGNSFAGAVSWDPSMSISGNLGARLDLGVGAMKAGTASTDGLYLVGAFNALATWRMNDTFSFEAGPGYQVWILGASTKNFAATAGALYDLQSPLLWVIHGFHLDYTASFQTNNLAHQIRLGVAIL